MSHMSYNEILFSPAYLWEVASKISQAIMEDIANGANINSIAVCGNSGTIIGGLISGMTKLPIVLVRKQENCHSDYCVEYNDYLLEHINYCFVDDLISSGSTITRVVEKITNKCGASIGNKLEKIYLYRDKRQEYIINMGGSLGKFVIPCHSIYVEVPYEER